MFLFERVGAAMPKTLFDMGFFMADMFGLDCPPWLLKINGWCSSC
jgi:hypothetical protein